MKLTKKILLCFFCLFLNIPLGNAVNYSTAPPVEKVKPPVERKKKKLKKDKFRFLKKKRIRRKLKNQTNKSSPYVILGIILNILLLIGLLLIIFGIGFLAILITGIIIISLANFENVLHYILYKTLPFEKQKTFFGKTEEIKDERIGYKFHEIFFVISAAIGLSLLIWGIIIQFSLLWIFGIILICIPLLVLLTTFILMLIMAANMY